jgi:hypothetical protein
MVGTIVIANENIGKKAKEEEDDDKLIRNSNLNSTSTLIPTLNLVVASSKVVYFF